jgi:hypothetical protein
LRKIKPDPIFQPKYNLRDGILQTEAAVRTMRLSALFLAAILVGALAPSCGGGSSSMTSHELLSVSISPASTTSNQPVQFTATGNYASSPYTQTPLPEATWGVCTTDQQATTAITVTQSGVAQCAAGAKGTYLVWADSPPYLNAPVCNAITVCGGGCLIAGTAKLTCE